TNAATGKSQFLAYSRDEEIQLGSEATPELTKEYGGKVANPELQAYVTNIGVALGEDTNVDGQEDSALKTEIYPPLLPYKNKYP
ncbi:MAG TPA: hypothetical protein PLN89_05605, partial [Elusimicrobiota bacterium]|nr:hypothetical protein [Elusimicrobiota bacterium]